MFRDNELLTGEDETMRQKDIEKFAFLYLCGQRDKDILCRPLPEHFSAAFMAAALLPVIGFLVSAIRFAAKGKTR